MSRFTESAVEEAARAWMESLGYGVLYGPDIATDESRVQRFTGTAV